MILYEYKLVFSIYVIDLGVWGEGIKAVIIVQNMIKFVCFLCSFRILFFLLFVPINFDARETSMYGARLRLASANERDRERERARMTD